MSSVLFIIPTCSSNGTNSSLSGIWNVLKDKYKIYILTINRKELSNYSFLSSTINSRLLYYYYGEYSTFSFRDKVGSFLLKICKRIISNQILDNVVNKIAARRIESRHSFDFVVAFQEGLPTRIATNFKCKNKIAWIHCDYSRYVPSDKDESLLYSMYSKIICVSQYTMNKFLSRYPLMKEKTMFIYNIFDAERIISMSNDSNGASIIASTFYNIISIGRMDPVKRFSYIPMIASELKRRKIKFRWYIIGGPQNNEFDCVERNIMKYKVQEEVVLLGQMSNPYRILAQSDLYVSTSCSEACPMVFLEAKALDKPIVSANFGSAIEFVDKKYISSLENIHEKILAVYNDRSNLKISHYSRSFFKVYNEKIIEQLDMLFSK